MMVGVQVTRPALLIEPKGVAESCYHSDQTAAQAEPTSTSLLLLWKKWQAPSGEPVCTFLLHGTAWRGGEQPRGPGTRTVDRFR